MHRADLVEIKASIAHAQKFDGPRFAEVTLSCSEVEALIKELEGLREDHAALYRLHRDQQATQVEEIEGLSDLVEELKGELEASQDIIAGRVTTYGSDSAFLRSFDAGDAGELAVQRFGRALKKLADK